MKLKVIVFVMCWTCMVGAFSQSDDVVESGEQETLDSLLTQLAKAKLSKTGKIIDKIEARSGRELLPLFENMIEGKLYYIRENYRVVRIEDTETSSEKYVFDIQTGESLGTLSKKKIKKIRVNNRLRGQLRGASARIQLLHGTAKERKTAAFFILDNISEENVAILNKALEDEEKSSVKEAIKTALSLYELKTNPDVNERIEAVAILSKSLEPVVRNEFNNILRKDSDGKYLEKNREILLAAENAVRRIEGRIGFYGFIEQFFFGLSAGSVLLLVAIGLAITFGVMGVINMAHGEMIMIGAYTTYLVQQALPSLINSSVFIAIPLAFLVAALVGMLIQYTVIRHLHGRPLETLLATFGISLILQQLARTIISPKNVPVSTPDWMSGSLEINPVFSLTFNRIYILLFSIIVFVSLLLIIKKTSLGLYVRAVSQNRDMAKALGVKTGWVDAMTFGLGSGIAGVAGVALSQLTNVGPNLGQQYIIESFMVVVFGGVGNILGTLFGGFSLGIANKFLEPATGAVLANILVLVFIILFIQRRPKGLFPQKGRAAE